MARIPRMVITGEPTVYHIISRTALDGFVLGDVEKEFLLNLIKRLSSVYFAEVLGFCIMGTHAHLLCRMHPGDGFTDEEIRKRFFLYYGPDHRRELSEERIQFFREKWGNLSEYVREIKQMFSRYYNKMHGRRGFFWGDRFKSVIVGVHPEMRIFVRVQGAREPEKRSVLPVREHFRATEQRRNRAKRPFLDGH